MGPDLSGPHSHSFLKMKDLCFQLPEELTGPGVWAVEGAEVLTPGIVP